MGAEHALEETVEEEKKKEAQKKDQWRFSEDRNQCRFFFLSEVSIPRYVYCRFLLHSHYPFVMY